MTVEKRPPYPYPLGGTGGDPLNATGSGLSPDSKSLRLRKAVEASLS